MPVYVKTRYIVSAIILAASILLMVLSWFDLVPLTSLGRYIVGTAALLALYLMAGARRRLRRR
ncbi:MAG: hypothetical protein K2L16_02175 [Muribaculaceae bacterium]|nr:hypothetical protein [Muribaculaceae bacterium]